MTIMLSTLWYGYEEFYNFRIRCKLISKEVYRQFKSDTETASNTNMKQF